MPAAAAPTLLRFFGRGGSLEAAHPTYEHRPGQIEMADEVAAALADRRHLLIEAGTGTGKTLAYLLPALQSGRRVLISTGTRNLQEQLVAKDIPLLAQALGRELSVVSMKGRGNYACRHKIETFESQPALLDAFEHDLYASIRAWAERTATGDQAELESLPDNHPLWGRLNARRETCTGSKCPRYEDCFLTQLHQRAAAAELVVVNHHLFFADLMLKRQELPGVLPPYEAVVFDEAHELESTASQYFGIAVSSHQIEEALTDAHRTLQALDLASADLDERMDRVRVASQKLLARVSAREGRHAFERRAQFLEENAAIYDECQRSLAHLHSGLEVVQDKPEEVTRLAQRFAELRSKFEILFEGEQEGVVYWVERSGRNLKLLATPLEVAPLLQEMLFGPLDTAVLTSATLAVDGAFEYVKSRLGLESPRERVIASPYRFDQQALLYIPADLPAPNDPEYFAPAADEIAALIEASRGRAFVLCTSYSQMRLFHAQLEPRLPFPLLLQGTAPRHALLDRFRSTPGAVLFATSSFWQGVDVQGEQLSLVIVDKLPFAPPNDPVTAARIRSLKQQGRDAFDEFQIPEAVLALKQGFGRLIRSSTDRGVVALLDSRVLSKGYGRHFLASLPDFRRAASLAEVRQFFAAQ